MRAGLHDFSPLAGWMGSRDLEFKGPASVFRSGAYIYKNVYVHCILHGLDSKLEQFNSWGQIKLMARCSELAKGGWTCSPAHLLSHCRKAERFFDTAGLESRLASASVIIMPALEVMGSLFDDARDGAQSGSVKPLCTRATSPASRTVEMYARRLLDQHHRDWLPIVGPTRNWSPLHLHAAAKGTYTIIGGLFLRTIYPYKGWPWALAALLSNNTAEADKAKVRTAFKEVSHCCCDHFTWRLRSKVHDEAGLNAQAEFVDDMMSMAASSNVRIECRFARMKNHSRANAGNQASAATTFAEHVLSESWCMYQAVQSR